MTSFLSQARNNAVALISLVVALSSLGYNTWRNEHTERNQNVRTAGFDILTKLAEFERVVFLAQYDRDANGAIRHRLDLRDRDPGPFRRHANRFTLQATSLQKVWARTGGARQRRRRSHQSNRRCDHEAASDYTANAAFIALRAAAGRGGRVPAMTIWLASGTAEGPLRERPRLLLATVPAARGLRWLRSEQHAASRGPIAEPSLLAATAAPVPVPRVSMRSTRESVVEMYCAPSRKPPIAATAVRTTTRSFLPKPARAVRGDSHVASQQQQPTPTPLHEPPQKIEPTTAPALNRIWIRKASELEKPSPPSAPGANRGGDRSRQS